MKRAKTRFASDGKLFLPCWSYSVTGARVSHRRNVLATFKEQRQHALIEYFVCSNHKGTLFWIHAVGPGFAGDRSRCSNTVSTRSRALADLWIEAVKTGRVGIE